jgi:hypothetical protein
MVRSSEEDPHHLDPFFYFFHLDYNYKASAKFLMNTTKNKKKNLKIIIIMATNYVPKRKTMRI